MIQNYIQNLKQGNSYPNFKNKYEDTIKNVMKLVQEKSKVLKEFEEIKCDIYNGYSSLSVF